MLVHLLFGGCIVDWIHQAICLYRVKVCATW